MNIMKLFITVVDGAYVKEQKQNQYSLTTVEKIAKVINRAMDERLKAWKDTIKGLGLEEDFEAEKHLVLAQVIKKLQEIGVQEHEMFPLAVSYLYNASNEAAEKFYNDFIKEQVEIHQVLFSFFNPGDRMLY